MKRLAVALGCVALTLSASTPRAQSPAVKVSTIQTTPEKTDFRETSRYADVMAFLEAIDRASPAVHLTSFGTTNEKRALPLAIVGAPDASPEAVRRTGKLRVYIQGNIHAGEVEGKESAQMLLRELAEGKHEDWLNSMVLIIAPIYNADGNERFALNNRGPQHGPLGGQGQRPNAQGLDLNRDHMKLDSPEGRAVVKLMNDYDPHVSMDLHTTNGTHHAYFLTYAPPLNPATDAAITRLLRLEWLPRVTAVIKAKYGWDFYYYGNLQGTKGEPGSADERSWRSFDHRPRFNNNYIGLRNRFAVLSEAYAYARFRDRILATSRFVEENLNYVRDNAASIRTILEQADAKKIIGSQLPLGAELERAPELVEILLGEVAQEKHPGRWARHESPKGRQHPGKDGGVRNVQGSADRAGAVRLLRSVSARRRDRSARRLTASSRRRSRPQRPWRWKSFGSTAATPPRGRSRITTSAPLKGAWVTADRELPAGTLRVDMTQPLARLAFYLLEPRSDDGLTNWNFLDEALRDAKVYPIVRTRN